MKFLEKRKEKRKKRVQSLVDDMEKARLYEYARYIKHPYRLLIFNFFIGLFRGLGSTIGLAIVLAGLVFALQWAINSDLPILSDWLENIVNYVRQFKS